MDDGADSLHDIVAASLPTLGRAGRQVGRVLLDDYPSAGLSTIADLAARAGVSPPTVLRFAQGLGFSGFTEFQRALRDELTRRSSGPLVRLGAPAGAGTPREVIVRDAAAQAERTVASLGRIPDASYEAAIALLADTSRRILLTGGRFTYLAAFHLGTPLQQLRPGVRMFSDPGGHDLGTVIDMSRRDVLVLYDFHRYQRSAAQLAQSAKKRGAAVLLVTDSLECPTAPHADVVLNVPTATEHAFQSDAAAFLLNEQLHHLVLERLGESALTRLALWERMREDELLP
ncbi:RpiR family transcriptional regulator [Microbacterium mangrovi]|uniref:RpiR family transcriptional regulator n=1 Tax=Microbacterium mangrovi TaxID=1348253 RepID=A0A0B2A6V4_9MICO|nr:MurR/RpiR family transcriptional regulator [Microbacterium mangrovi]KHK97326.1 RpiR family transcriptional regulator [Microbacterium mangrovi]